MAEIKKLSEVVEILNGYAFESKKYVEAGLRIIRIANVQDGVIVDNLPCFYPVNTDVNIEKYKLFENDLLLSLTGNVGRVGILPVHMLPAVLNQRVCCLRPKSQNVSYKYLYYYLLRRCFVEDCIKASKGVAQLNLSTKWLANYPIYIPNISKQEHIISRIEELFSQLDTSVAELKTAKERLRVYRQAVLKEAFEKVKVHIPFGKIIDARLGKMLDKEKNTGNYRKYLRNINVRWFSFDLSDLLEMRIEDDEIEKYSVSHNDLIICEGGEPGRCAVWDKHDSIFYQKALHRVRFLDNSNPKFYMYYLWFSAQAGQLCRYFTGTGIKHLTGQSLSKVVVPKTDRPTQDSIVAEIESRLSVCDSIENTVDTALQQAEALRQSILKKAFEGKL